MQTLESLGVPASAFLIPHSMPEAPNNGQQGWVHPPQQGYSAPMDQGNNMNPNAQANHIFVMNNVKPEQQIPRREEAISSPPTPNPSVITATYNPTYNRCLPKILSDLDCEMKIKQVLRCIENILLENGDVDLQQQAYKLPDRSLSPQFAKTKRPKMKDDEEMLLSPSPGAINLPLATNSPATLINKAANKNTKVNVKVEPDVEKVAGRPVYNEQPQPHNPPTGSPRAHMFDFSYKHSPAQQPHPSPQQYAHSPLPPQSRQFPYDNYSNSPHPSHPSQSQPMIPHIQLSMSSPHLSNPTATSSPHLQHLHASHSSPHLHASHNGSPHLHSQHSPLQHSHTSSPLQHSHANSPLQHSHASSPLQHTHTNSPHLVHSPHPHSPLVQTQAPSPHLPASNGNVLSPPQSIPVQQYQVLTHPDHPSESHNSDSIGQQDYHYQHIAEGVQAGGFKSENPQLHPAPQQAQKKEPMDFVLDPTLFAQYLAQNQHQLQQLQIQLHQQQLQHTQLQQQRIHLQQQQQQHNNAQQNNTPQTSQQNTQQQQTAQQSQAPQQPAAPTTTTTTSGAHQPPAHLQHLFDPAHPMTLSGHPMSLSGHLLQQIGPDGTIRLEEDDKWILSLLNMDSSIAHDLSLSGHIPPL